jgi:MFS family permease
MTTTPDATPVAAVTDVAAARPHRRGRRALILSLIAIGLFVLSFIVGIVVAALGPNTESVWAWAPLIFPALVSVVSTVMLIVSVAIAIRSLMFEGRGGQAIAAIVIAVLALVPIGAIAFGVSVLLTGNG